MIPPPHVPPTPQQRRHYVCPRALRPLTAEELDGRLDKAFWANAPWTEEFVDIQGDARPCPRFRTRAKILWDDSYLYIGAELEEPHVWATLTQRDSIVYHDNDFEVFLNPTGDSHRYYELEINALGTIFDLFLAKPYRDGGSADHDWNVEGLLSATHVRGTLNDPRDRDEGWSVELAFPWRAFDRHGGTGAPPRPGERWRINFSRVQWDLEVDRGRYRKVPAVDEHNWVWSPQGIVDMHRPEQWGYLQFSGQTRAVEAFVPDPSERARDRLHRVYYAQRAFREAHGRWASTWDELSAGPGAAGHSMRDSGGAVLAVRSSDGWTARIREADLPGAPVWCIAEDSRVWREP